MISIVIPIFNEQDILPELRRRLTAAMDSTGLEWEAILVNDGSRDRSAEIIRQFNREDARFKLIALSRNFGHQPAVTAGVHHARGDAVVLIDGDLQDPPEVIPEMIKAWQAGAKVVVGERRSRADRGLRGIGFRLFYPIFNRISELPHGPDAGIFSLLDRRVVEEFNKLPERNRFIPGLRGWLGFEPQSVLYDRQERAAGKPKQTLGRLIRYAMDGMLSFSYKPLRVATWLGVIVSGGSFALIVLYLTLFILGVGQPFGQGFYTLVMLVLFLGGVQLLSIGVLGEYIGRIYEEIKQRPLYVIEDKVGFEPPPSNA
jgi:glycosyltransferase involved in cell wall biosynthesis